MSRRVEAISGRAVRAARESASPDAIRTQALLDLLYDSSSGKSLQRAISSLRTATRLTDHPAPILADVAAAHLVRAERGGGLRDLLAAIEAAEEALEHDPRNQAALFNRALAVQRLGLSEEAARDWRAYLATDSTSAWADEVGRRLRRTLGEPSAPPAPGPEEPLASYSAYAAADAQGGRVVGWCRVLGAWAEATLAGDTARAKRHLDRAEALGAALETRSGGDASLADAVRVVRRAGADRTRNLARAHREFASGCTLDEGARFDSAALRFAAAGATAEGSPALQAWARVQYGNMTFRGAPRRGETILREVAAATDPVRYPALAGRARLALAAVLLRGDRYVSAVEQARQAAELFDRAGERENAGVTFNALAVAAIAWRDVDEGYAMTLRALERLRPYRSSYRLHNLLSSTAEVAAGDGFARAAVRIQDEGVRVTEGTGDPAYLAEALLTRARLLAGAGDLARAQRDVVRSRRLVDGLTDPRARDWMVAQRQMAEAVTSFRASSERAAGALDSAAAFFLKIRAPLVALPAVVDGAQARLATGDVPRGTARLEAALAILEQRRDSIRMEPRRAAVFEAARAVVDRVAMLKLASGDTAEALGYLDRGRASLAAVGRMDTREARRTVAGPAGEVALEYALVGDTLLVWTVAGRHVDLFRTVIDTARLVRTIERVRRRLEERAGERDVRPDLARLYDWLVRPVESRLGRAGGPLVVVADGDIASIPFAALYDAARGRYLVQGHPLRAAASLREALPQRQRTDARGAAVFVADPAFDPGQNPGFERLPQARDEVREVSAGYPRVRVLSDGGATGNALRDALASAEVVHYAGHAVFDDDRPERSYLLLAPTGGVAPRGTLEAEEIAQLDLRHLRLVVLAACQTMRTGPGRAAGFSGLSGAFLAAGAGGAVGSLWEVDDRLTRPLMIEFHRAYRDSRDGPGALRAAQLRLLQSGDDALRSPAAWAGFRFLGS